MNRMLKGMAVVAGMLVMTCGAWGQYSGVKDGYDQDLNLKFTNIGQSSLPLDEKYADMDGDGHMDSVVVTAHGDIDIFYKRANSHETQRVITDFNPIHAVTVNDFNMDGTNDVIFATNTGNVYYVANFGDKKYKKPVKLGKLPINPVSLDSYTSKNKNGEEYIVLSAITANGGRYEIRDMEWNLREIK